MGVWGTSILARAAPSMARERRESKSNVQFACSLLFDSVEQTFDWVVYRVFNFRHPAFGVSDCNRRGQHALRSHH